MAYELIFLCVFLTGLAMQHQTVVHILGSDGIGLVKQDVSKSGRAWCFVGGLGLGVMLMGVELFLVVFTVGCCLISYSYRCLYPKQLKKTETADSFLGDIVSFCHEYATFLLIVFVIRNFFFQHYRVPTGSLEPTVRPGDFLLVNQFSYGWHLPIINTKIANYGEPKRGDIALFRYPNDPYRVIYVKRVVGLPGDRIEYRNKQLKINGHSVPQEYIGLSQELGSGRYEWLSKRKEYLPGKPHDILVRSGFGFDEFEVDLVVPEGSYYMMGDNRDHSLDSRVFGPVDQKYLLGKVMFVLFSWDGWSVDWSRIGEKV